MIWKYCHGRKLLLKFFYNLKFTTLICFNGVPWLRSLEPHALNTSPDFLGLFLVPHVPVDAGQCFDSNGVLVPWFLTIG